MNQPSEEAMIKAMEYLMRTSIPRLLRKREESQRSNRAEINEEMNDKLPND